jgi:hypothetical protein
MRKLVCVEIPREADMASLAPWSLYAVIVHERVTRAGRALVPAGFPWRTTIYRSGREVESELAGPSNVGTILNYHNVSEVYLMGVDPAGRAELDKSLANLCIQLVT